MNIFETIVGYLVNFFEIAGTAIVIWGGLQGIFYFLKHELKGSEIKKIERVRYILGHKMLIGLEFFLAGDILGTIITPSYDELGKLAILVAIRTALGFFLNVEVRGKKHFSGKA